MKSIHSLPGSIMLALLISTTAAFADFSGSFSGPYAPANWSVNINGSSGYQNSAYVNTDGVPNLVLIYGAIGPGGSTSPSVIDYLISLPGSGSDPESVSFAYDFFVPGGTVDQAQVLRNGLVIATLNAGASQFSSTGLFYPGDTLYLRVYSDNGEQPDTLAISPVPEPSTLALTGLGCMGLLWQCRRKFRNS